MSGIELDKLEHIIASMLDHPSVFMGGPSRQSRRTARRIVDEVVAWNTRSQSERERRLEEALVFLRGQHPCCLGITEAECDAPYGLDHPHQKQPCCIARKLLP